MTTLASKSLAAAFVGLITLIACLVGSQFAWRFNQSRIERQIFQIGEIYLDGLVASIKTGAQAGSIGDVDRRLKSAFTEQSGIKELALMVFDAEGRMTNIAGRKVLATEAVTNLEPGAFLLDLENKTIVVSRRFGENKARATAILDITFVLRNYSYAEQSTVWAAALAAVAAAIASFAAMFFSVSNTEAQAQSKRANDASGVAA